MKKKIELHSNNADPFAVYNFCKDVLKEYGNGSDIEKLDVYKKEQKKEKTIEYYGNDDCGFVNAFHRDIEMGVAYIIHSEYTLYGLRGKNKLVVNRAFHTSVWEENEMDLKFVIKGEKDFVDFNLKTIENHFPRATKK